MEGFGAKLSLFFISSNVFFFVFAQSFRNIHTDIYDKVSCTVSVTLYGRQPLASQAYHLARLCARFYFDFYFSVDGRDFRIAAQCRSGDIQKVNCISDYCLPVRVPCAVLLRYKLECLPGLRYVGQHGLFP